MTTVKELRTLAKQLKIRGYSTASKAQLLELLENYDKTETVVTRARNAKEPKKDKVPKKTQSVDETGTFEQEESPVEEPTTEPKKTKQKKARTRAPNAWNSFLADYRKENNATLKQAMAAKEAYATYKESWKPTEPDEPSD
jgi:hypothetical protein